LLVVPITLVVILLLSYFNTRSVAKTAIITLAVPFSAVGALWMIYLLGYNMSIAVWVGIIALLGIDAETGVFMLLYLDWAFAQASRGKERLTRRNHEAYRGAPRWRNRHVFHSGVGSLSGDLRNLA
jgi:Cu(I)/Ag(I) efflux system membrane protein CusA/SilA